MAKKKWKVEAIQVKEFIITADTDGEAEDICKLQQAPVHEGYVYYESTLLDVACQNCTWAGNEEDVKPIKDLEQRVGPGEMMPVGECPECGALCHYQTE